MRTSTKSKLMGILAGTIISMAQMTPANPTPMNITVHEIVSPDPYSECLFANCIKQNPMENYLDVLKAITNYRELQKKEGFVYDEKSNSWHRNSTNNFSVEYIQQINKYFLQLQNLYQTLSEEDKKLQTETQK